MNKKTLSMLMVPAMLMSTMAGATVANAASDEKTTVVFWNSWTGGDGETLRALVDKFNEESDSVYIDMTQTTSFSDMMQTSLPTGNAADLVLLDSKAMNTYDGYLRPIDDIWENTSLKAEDFVSSYLDLCYHTDGEMYLIPFQISTYMLYYNKDLFEAAGLDPDAPPTTFAEWDEYARKISELSTDDNPIYGSGLFYCYNGQNNSILQRYAGYTVAEDEDGVFYANLADNEALVEGLMWMKALYADGINPLERDIDSMMAAGQIGLMTNGGWLKGSLDASDVNYGIAKLPTVEAEDQDNWSLGDLNGFAITTSATDETAAAAQEFIEWWMTGTGLEASELTNDVDYSSVTPNAEWSISMFYLNAYTPTVESEEYQAVEALVAMTPSDEAQVASFAPAGCLATSAAQTAVADYVQEWIFDYPADATEDDLLDLLETYNDELQDAVDEAYGY